MLGKSDIAIVMKDDSFSLESDEGFLGYYDTLDDALEIRLLCIGIKPVVSQSFDVNQLPLLVMYEFPHFVKSSKDDPEILRILFFQNEELKARYLNECQNSRGLTYKEKFGELLGYPPIAIADYLERMRELSENKRISSWKRIDYHGQSFICKEENVQSCLDWLDKQYNIPFKYQTGIHITDPFK
jgi:hypothetical protein